MSHNQPHDIIEEYTSFLQAKEYPCIAARAAIKKQQVKCLVVDHMACPGHDMEILQFLYNFIDGYRRSSDCFHSAAVIFKAPAKINDDLFEALLWQRLQALTNLDGLNYNYDHRVDSNPLSPHFSFSLKEEALFIIGMHAANSRPARRFSYPTLVFNPHAQFEQLREMDRYLKIKNIVRQRDLEYSGSVNTVLDDFGNSSEVYQYSGRVYDEKWKCPLKPNHERIENNPTP